ncbi:Lipopolysaccharide export system permease protein LptG [Aquimixticola soesokkakensis]|uniref:Lipopolysaccharide export system permease protein LptG n=1 Tax=Aquimixticola soesokkakensis TaxID=1519096 RepID=A0A1Y5TIJ2_9RHOB|nr:LPS export ABC transporter permease LptG [Aquimixticola soesokkakensis]SLN64932.1 Lipopolysaccharide export system permease protein LptG [Aquimixticola soesokkakensis]
MKLHFYFARRFALTFAMVFALLFGLFVMVDLVEELQDFSKVDLGFLPTLGMTLLNVPQGLYQLLPIIVLIATLVMFLGLARSSELVVTRAAGRSAMRALLAPISVIFIIGVLCVTVFNPMVSATSRQYDLKRTELLKGEQQVFSVSDEGLWLRQGSDAGHFVIRASRSNLDATELFGVTFMGFGPDNAPTERIEATSARLTTGAWVLTQAKVWPLRASDNPERDATTAAQMTIDTTLTLDEIRDSFGTPSAIPFWDLPQFIARLEAAGFSARAYRMWYQSELALPFAFVAMLMIGAGFTMRHTRLGRTGPAVLSALMLAFGFYFLRNFATVLGENGQLPVIAAAWVPPLAVILLTLSLLLHFEDG